jgi:hypothetical protein
MMMINTTITIAPINRFMGLFTFVSSFSFYALKSCLVVYARALWAQALRAAGWDGAPRPTLLPHILLP